MNINEAKQLAQNSTVREVLSKPRKQQMIDDAISHIKHAIDCGRPQTQNDYHTKTEAYFVQQYLVSLGYTCTPIIRLDKCLTSTPFVFIVSGWNDPSPPESNPNSEFLTANDVRIKRLAPDVLSAIKRIEYKILETPPDTNHIWAFAEGDPVHFDLAKVVRQHFVNHGFICGDIRSVSSEPVFKLSW